MTFFSFEEYYKCTSIRKQEKNLKNYSYFASLRSLTKRAGSGSVSQGTDLRIRICTGTKMSRIQNTGYKYNNLFSTSDFSQRGNCDVSVLSYSYSPAFTIQPQARTGGGNKFFQQRIVLQESSIPDNESHYFAVKTFFTDS